MQVPLEEILILLFEDFNIDVTNKSRNWDESFILDQYLLRLKTPLRPATQNHPCIDLTFENTRCLAPMAEPMGVYHSYHKEILCKCKVVRP